MRQLSYLHICEELSFGFMAPRRSMRAKARVTETPLFLDLFKIVLSCFWGGGGGRSGVHNCNTTGSLRGRNSDLDLLRY